ncbi:hypothetical protein [Dinghuibacter silviterrae]|uniref:TonB-like protein n=1 Tax=Dinghuibacter silviterrae TaxID=1539049 RepID=A0A4R8DRP3_9BACT|nr:hypothetical protein [Dinghuibacter silviterrae]TDX00882.1 hypothetical protein EDB95_1911 [Dinghuibacter silviterrae]
MRRLLTLLILGCALHTYAQKADTLLISPHTQDRTQILRKVDTLPVYPGGAQAWVRDLKSAVKRNSASIDDDGIASMGECELEFVVWYDGTAGNVRALTMGNSRLAEVAADFINHTKGWIPAKQHGIVVNTYLKVKVKYP